MVMGQGPRQQPRIGTISEPKGMPPENVAASSSGHGIRGDICLLWGWEVLILIRQWEESQDKFRGKPLGRPKTVIIIDFYEICCIFLLLIPDYL